MSPAVWGDIPLDTTLGSLSGTSFLAAAKDGHALGTVLAPRSTASPFRLVEAWIGTGSRTSRRSRDLPRNQTLAACCLLLGLTAQQAMRVPAVDWLRTNPSVRVGDEWWGPERLREQMPMPAAHVGSAAERVDHIKQEYGRLRGDLVYRLENAALFDPAVGLTQQFETSLVLWDNVSPGTPEAEVVRRASMVQVTFDTARAHAETVGINHLPMMARTSVERAAKAARLARQTSSEAERRTALDRVTRILRALALYYLPDPDAIDRAITAS